MDDVAETVPVAPAHAIDPHLQRIVELLTQALSRARHTKDPTLTYIDEARRIGAVDFDWSGDPTVAEDWIKNMDGRSLLGHED